MNRLKELICILLTALICVSTRAEDISPESPLSEAKEETPGQIKSVSGRFVIYGKDRARMLDCASWFEEIAGNVEKILKIKIPKDRNILILKLIDNPDAESGNIVSLTQKEKGILSSVVTVVNYEKADIEKILENTCDLLVRDYIKRNNNAVKSADADDPAVPKWFIQGISQCIYPELKKRNADLVIKMWRSGELKPLSYYLEDVAYGASRDVESTKAVRCIFMDMLMNRYQEKSCINSIMKRVSENAAIDADWLFKDCLGYESVPMIDEAWDKWIIRWKKIICLPGSTTKDDVNKLKQNLVLSIDKEGGTLMDPHEFIRFGAVIKRKDEEPIRKAAAAKIVELNMISVGRSDDFRQTVDAYNAFLREISQGSSMWALKGLLDNANELMSLLEKKYLLHDDSPLSD